MKGLEKLLKMPRIQNRQNKVDSFSPEERKNKSLCLPYANTKMEKEKKLKLPQLSIHHEKRSPPKDAYSNLPTSSRAKGIIADQYALLFIDDKLAKHY